MLRRLAADIEVKARAKLAHRLAEMKNAPPVLIRSLAFDDAIEVAEPVLIHSERLTDDDLVENATTKNQDHLFAIAQRLKLSEKVADVLVERGDDRVVHKVVKNKGARFSLAGYGKLTSRARYDRKLTLALGERSDIPRQYFLKLLEAASSTVRAKLEAANPQLAAAIRDTVDDVATTMQRDARKNSQAHAVAVREAKRRFNVRPITEASVHGPVHAQDFEKTAVALARLGVFPIDLVERALLDEGEDMLLLLAKAAGCSWTTARELLVMYAANRSLTADDVTMAFERYRKLSQQTAKNIIVFYERRMKLRTAGIRFERQPKTSTRQLRRESTCFRYQCSGDRRHRLALRHHQPDRLNSLRLRDWNRAYGVRQPKCVGDLGWHDARPTASANM